jgi:hypothetical protein
LLIHVNSVRESIDQPSKPNAIVHVVLHLLLEIFESIALGSQFNDEFR